MNFRTAALGVEDSWNHYTRIRFLRNMLPSFHPLYYEMKVQLRMLLRNQQLRQRVLHLAIVYIQRISTRLIRIPFLPIQPSP